MSDATDMLIDIARAAAAATTMHSVYPGYIASRIKKALPAADSERILVSVGEITPLGDCRHALTVTDFNGTEYRITVEVIDRKGGAA